MASPACLGNGLASDHGVWGQKLLRVPSAQRRDWGGGSGAPLPPSAFSLYDMRVGCHRVFGVACRLSPVACRLSSCRKTW